MGLITAAGASISSVLGDQWKEYFYCSEMDTNVLVRKGQKNNGKSGRERSSMSARSPALIHTTPPQSPVSSPADWEPASQPASSSSRPALLTAA